MQVFVNGTAREIEAGSSAQQLVASLDRNLDGVVLVINDAVIPKDRLAQTQIRQNDRVELVRMVGGG